MKILTLTCGAEVLLDDDVYENIPKTGWYLSSRLIHNPNTDYVVHDTYGKMHRYILGIKPNEQPDLVVDHIDHNGLNNQKSNLRLCSTSENKRNITTHYPNNPLKFTGINAEIQKNKPSNRFRVKWSEGEPKLCEDGKRRAKQMIQDFSFLKIDYSMALVQLKKAILYRVEKCRENGYTLDERSTTIEQAILNNFECDIEKLLDINLKELHLVE